MDRDRPFTQRAHGAGVPYREGKQSLYTQSGQIPTGGPGRHNDSYDVGVPRAYFKDILLRPKAWQRAHALIEKDTS